MAIGVPEIDDTVFVEALTCELPRLTRLAFRLCPQGVEPADLAQDVVERAWRSRSSFTGASTMATWLHTIAVNRVIDLTRSAAYRRARVDRHVLLTSREAQAAAGSGDASDTVAGPLRMALAVLPDRDRMILVLHDGEGWETTAVAEMCGLTVAATHKRLQRARAKVAAQLSRVQGTGEADDEQCGGVLEHALDFVRGTLTATEYGRVEEHLRTCPNCPAIAQALVGLVPMVQTLAVGGEVSSYAYDLAWRVVTGDV